MSKLDNAICYNCGEILSFIEEQKILRHEECLKCQSSLHCCRMCVFYDKSSYNECREPLAERILEKEKANFCSYYKISGGEQSNTPKKEDLFAAADALFKKKD